MAKQIVKITKTAICKKTSNIPITNSSINFPAWYLAGIYNKPIPPPANKHLNNLPSLAMPFE